MSFESVVASLCGGKNSGGESERGGNARERGGRNRLAFRPIVGRVPLAHHRSMEQTLFVFAFSFCSLILSSRARTTADILVVWSCCRFCCCREEKRREEKRASERESHGNEKREKVEKK